MSKTIGILGWKTGDNSFGCSIHYLDFISQFGTPRIIMPQDDLVNVDLLVLPGGADVNPFSFGEAPGFYTSNTDVHKQYFFDAMLQQYINKRIPILGICLGMQQLAAHFGCTITQNFFKHEQSKQRWETAHNLTAFNKKGTHIVVEEATELKPPFKFEVNSHHHQGITSSNFNWNELLGLFYAFNHDDRSNNNFNDVIIEIFKHRELPIYGVQYHPEELRDDVSKNIILKLLNNENI